MKPKHTPGPWYVKTATTFNNPDENNNLIEYKWVGFGTVGDETPVLARHLKENGANAHLIAAAPELLENFEKAINLIEHMSEKFGYCVSVTIGDGRKLIAKARGES